MTDTVILLPGDGIGPSIASAVVRILDAAGADIDWQIHHAGAETIASHGDILSDLCSGLVGGLGVTPGVNIGDGVAVFEAVHGSAPDIAGKNLANPTALLISGVLMMRQLGKNEVADRVIGAICRTLEANIKTRDVGGSASTSEYTEAIVARLE